MKTIKTLCIAGTFAALAIPALADGTMDHSKVDHSKMDHAKMGDMKMAQAGAADMTDAEVRKVDLAQGKLTLKHGEIKNLDMPPMTMVFSVKDKAMLDGVKPGDKVRFKATSEGGKMTVIEMTPAR
jgi:Cu(I)/Ag(I) efflux system periplasmic protein CusF